VFGVAEHLKGGDVSSTVGVICAAITCFNSGGAVDLGQTHEHVDWLIEGGVHALIVSGTCGEFGTLAVDDRKTLIAKFVEWVDGRVPVYAGVMHTSTDVAVTLARHAEQTGASAVMSVSPYYSGPPEREILAYFRDIAEAIEIPLIVYNNPWASGVSLSIPALAKLANEGTAAMIKDSNGDPSRLHDLRALVPESTALIYGEDYGSFEALLAGADGWVAGVSNFMPRHAVKLWDLIASGKFDEARGHWYEILPLVNITSHKEFFGMPEERPDFIQVYKSALETLGFAAGPCRRPLLPLTDEEAALLERLIAEARLTRGNA
jgi:dihydrodipicolinate synthase/N-acetylneuraminate lyase